MKPFVAEMMNATAIAFDRQGQMYVSSRHDGAVYRVAPNGTMTTYAEGMGIATGIAFDRNQNLYVGDRSGTIFKIGRDQQVFVFATLEPSVSAYHLAFGPQGDLFVTGPTTSSFDCVHRIDPQGTVHKFFRGLGRPQGLAFDSSWQSVCGGFALRQARHREDHAGGQRQPGSRWPRFGGTGLCAGTKRNSGNHRRGASSFLEHSGVAAAAGVAARQFSFSRQLRVWSASAAFFIYTSSRERRDHRGWL